MGLSEGKLARLKPGRHADDRNLLLVVTETGGRTWQFRYTSPLTHTRREMGLGGINTLSLEAARELAANYRRQVREGIDPIEARRAARTANIIAGKAELAARAITYEVVAREWLKAQPVGEYPKDREGWLAQQQRYVFPVIGALPINEIEVRACVQVFERSHGPSGRALWRTSPDTARAMRVAMEKVFGWAAALKGYRTGENPARWAGNLQYVWPRRSKAKQEVHHAALPWAEAPALMAQLRAARGVSARALEFAILTAARTSEVTELPWAELDLKARVWTVPADRMKGGREHEVPLCSRAIEILERLPRQRGNPYVFVGKAAKHLAESALEGALNRLQYNRVKMTRTRWVDPKQGGREITTHGFRSTFRDWVGDATDYDKTLAEAALAHAIGDKTEAAYARSTRLEKRRVIMQSWCDFCLQYVKGEGIQQSG